MKLISGNKSDVDMAIEYFRDLGYSKHKTRILMKIGSRAFDNTAKKYGSIGGVKKRHGMHTQFKEKKDLLIQLKRTIIDLGLHHGLSIDDINTELQDVLGKVDYAKNRRKK